MTDRWIEIYYKELAFVTMEAEKPYDLPFVHWRPKKARGNSVGCQKSKNQGTSGVNIGSRAGEHGLRCSSSICEAGGKGCIPSSSAFCSIQALNRLDEAHSPRGGSSYFPESIDPNADLTWKHPHRHP